MPRGKGIDEMVSWRNNAPGCAHLADNYNKAALYDV